MTSQTSSSILLFYAVTYSRAADSLASSFSQYFFFLLYCFTLSSMQAAFARNKSSRPLIPVTDFVRFCELEFESLELLREFLEFFMLLACFYSSRNSCVALSSFPRTGMLDVRVFYADIIICYCCESDELETVLLLRLLLFLLLLLPPPPVPSFFVFLSLWDLMQMRSVTKSWEEDPLTSTDRLLLLLRCWPWCKSPTPSLLSSSCMPEALMLFSLSLLLVVLGSGLLWFYCSGWFSRTTVISIPLTSI